ncbi:hypothetical protein [Novipirellula artificiosorum]|uniref:hypothetical protein n=1 Tax=Novipirellula artificiosorum TaxID=2528016 RepID=UPI0018CDE7F4|nr:hypothetical protein [Novipirellula artificiosorum]
MQIVNHLLRLGEVINMGKAIALFVVTDASLIQSTRKVFTPIQTNLDGHGKPSLQSDVHQAKVPIDKVEIEEQAFPSGICQFKTFPFPIFAKLVGLARFHT